MREESFFFLSLFFWAQRQIPSEEWEHASEHALEMLIPPAFVYIPVQLPHFTSKTAPLLRVSSYFLFHTPFFRAFLSLPCFSFNMNWSCLVCLVPLSLVWHCPVIYSSPMTRTPDTGSQIEVDCPSSCVFPPFLNSPSPTKVSVASWDTSRVWAK